MEHKSCTYKQKVSKHLPQCLKNCMTSTAVLYLKSSIAIMIKKTLRLFKPGYYTRITVFILLLLDLDNKFKYAIPRKH